MGQMREEVGREIQAVLRKTQEERRGNEKVVERVETQVEGWKRRSKEGLDSVTQEIEQLRGQVGQGQQAL